MNNSKYKADEDGLSHLSIEEKEAYQVAYENSLQGALDRLSIAANDFLKTSESEFNKVKDAMVKPFNDIIKKQWKE